MSFEQGELLIPKDALLNAGLASLTRLWIATCHNYKLTKDEVDILLNKAVDRNEVDENRKSSFLRGLTQNPDITWRTVMSGIKLLCLDEAYLNIRTTDVNGIDETIQVDLLGTVEPSAAEVDGKLQRPARASRALVVPTLDNINVCGNHLAAVLRRRYYDKRITWLRMEYNISNFALNVERQNMLRKSANQLKSAANKHCVKSQPTWDDFIGVFEMLNYAAIEVTLGFIKGDRHEASTIIQEFHANLERQL